MQSGGGGSCCIRAEPVSKVGRRPCAPRAGGQPGTALGPRLLTEEARAPFSEPPVRWI